MTQSEPDPRYAAFVGHPLARVPLGALLVAREYLTEHADDVDWDDPEDVRAVADAVVAELAGRGYLRLVDTRGPVEAYPRYRRVLAAGLNEHPADVDASRALAATARAFAATSAQVSRRVGHVVAALTRPARR